MTLNVVCSLFEDISSSQKGTILSVNGVSFIFHNNFVSSVSSTIYPGCILSTNGLLFDISRSSFSECCGQLQNDDNHANVFSCQTMEEDIVSDVSAFKCSPFDDIYADSVFHLSNGIAKANNCNLTYCYGKSGSSSFALWNLKNSQVKYLINDHGTEVCALEIHKCKIFTCSKSNFINGPGHHVIININNECNFDCCIFHNNGNIPILDELKKEMVHFTNSYTSYTGNSYQSLTQTDDPVLIPINVIQYQSCIIHQSKIILNHYCSKFDTLKLFVFVFISK